MWPAEISTYLPSYHVKYMDGQLVQIQPYGKRRKLRPQPLTSLDYCVPGEPGIR